MTKRTKSKQQTFKRKCDVLFSRIVRDRASNICENCGASHLSAQIQCAHWISRRYSWTRTDLRNAFALCATCHRAFTADPTGFSDWAIGKRGRTAYVLLRELAYRRWKFDWETEHVRLLLMCRLCWEVHENFCPSDMEACGLDGHIWPDCGCT